MPAPFEIVAGPIEVYIAPVGESFPLIGAEPPGGNWVLVGTEGASNTSEDGVTINLTETVEDFRTLGGTDIVKSFRTEEDMTISMVLADMTFEQVARALNFNTVTTDTDDKTIPLYKGAEVSYMALLVRGNDGSPYGQGYNLQFQVPRVRPSGEPEMVWVKGEPVGVAVEFMALRDLSAASDSLRFGIARAQFQN